MKLYILAMLFALVAAAPNLSVKNAFTDLDLTENVSGENKNSILVNVLIRQLFNYIRHIIKNGSAIFNIPPLDPLKLESFNLNIPAGIINLDLALENALGTGFGDFQVHRSHLNVSDLTFDIDISVPEIHISSEKYELNGDFFTAIPLYGNGNAIFDVYEFRFQGKLYLKQSDDEKSVVIDKIENAAFQIPKVKTKLTGVIGGGDIDAIVNAIIEEVLFDYVNRFQGAISKLSSEAILLFGNPILDQLDTWRFIAPLLKQ